MRRVSIDRIQEAGLEGELGLVTPAEYPDAEPQSPDHAEIVRRLMVALLPSDNTPGRRRWEAGYRRFLVLAHMICPDDVGAASAADLAEELGVTVWEVYRIRKLIRREIFKARREADQ